MWRGCSGFVEFKSSTLKEYPAKTSCLLVKQLFFVSIYVILTQVRGAGMVQSEHFSNADAVLVDGLSGATPIPRAFGSGEVLVSDSPAKLILSQFGFTIPPGAVIISHRILDFKVIQGTIATTFESYQTRDASTKFGAGTSVVVNPGTAAYQAGPVAILGGTPNVSVANSTGYGLIIETPRPPFGTIGASINYVTIEITYDDLVVAPVVLSGSAGDGAAMLSWTSNPQAATYRVERSLDGLLWASVFNGNGLTFTNVGLANGTTYRYRVFAIKADSTESVASNVLSLTPMAPLGAPSLLYLRKSFTMPSYENGFTKTDNPGVIEIRFAEVAGASLYEIQIRDLGQKEIDAWQAVYSGNGTEVQIPGVLTHGPWGCRVRAKVGDVFTPWSVEQTVRLEFVWDPRSAENMRYEN